MITTAMSTLIGARRERVWIALTNPQELMSWDEAIVSPIEPVSNYPQVGETVAWRYLLGTIPVVLRDQPLEVEPCELLRNSMVLGLFRFERTFTLTTELGDCEQTRITLKLVSSNSVPMVGGQLDRFSVRRMATKLVDANLRSLQKWCEQDPPRQALRERRVGSDDSNVKGFADPMLGLLEARAGQRR